VTRQIIIEIEDDKYDSFIEVIKKRPYIKHVSMSREDRRLIVNCPCCKQKLSRETSFVINEKMIDSLSSIVEKMRIAKTVILTNRENPLSLIAPIELERCVEVDLKTIVRCKILGLLQEFQDGSKITHFVTSKGIKFLTGESPAAPCLIITIDDEVIETSGEIMIDQVKFKDDIKRSSALHSSLSSVKMIPEYVMSFVTSGQMSFV
jgi:hypothetical protein